MRRVDFENGGIIPNIVQSAFPMLIAQVLNLLYNIVDRIYIARIPEIGTAALGAVGLCFPVIVIITASRRSATCSAAAARHFSRSPAAAMSRSAPGASCTLRSRCLCTAPLC